MKIKTVSKLARFGELQISPKDFFMALSVSILFHYSCISQLFLVRIFSGPIEKVIFRWDIRDGDYGDHGVASFSRSREFFPLVLFLHRQLYTAAWHKFQTVFQFLLRERNDK